MSDLRLLQIPLEPRPASYEDFLEEGREFVASKGASWEIPLDEKGVAIEGSAWDLRKLTGNLSRTASWLYKFSLEEPTRSAALLAGWAPASLPQGGTLSVDVQEFIKAYVAKRCACGFSPRDIRRHAVILKDLFSVTSSPPWSICSEDVHRYVELNDRNPDVISVISVLITTINQNMLSLRCPLEAMEAQKKRFEFAKRLTDRARSDRLPEADALHEIVRIAFQETPESHYDLIRFALLRMLILTGLRIGEVLVLPLDCLVWEEHVDTVTGRPAGEIGGVSRSLRIRYFAEKHGRYAPEAFVENTQWVPEKFHDAVVAAVQMAANATIELRRILKKKHSNPSMHQGSDLRVFRTTSGRELNTSDLLFLVQVGKPNLPETLEEDMHVGPAALPSIYSAISSPGRRATLFQRYSAPELAHLKIRPHSLRHLMNTEMFRLQVADTIITHHFGRKSVAQSYQYDHRSLAEKLSFIDLPTQALAVIPPGSPQDLVARMVLSGHAAGSALAQSFREIQRNYGDSAAFKYLAANADGFHVTPYGFCTNSFSMNPCSRHLKCFDGCRHFAASGRPEHIISLTALKKSLTTMRDAAMSRPVNSVGRKNQVAHAEKLLSGVTAALEAQPSASVFPDGPDHSIAGKDVFS